MDANRRAEQPTIYSIGHSNLSMDQFAEILASYKITLVVDVRSTPFSRFSPHFNRLDFEPEIVRRGLIYRYAGDFLGGRPPGTEFYRDGYAPEDRQDYLVHVDYERLSKSTNVQRGIKRLFDLAAEQTTAIMCSEEDPHHCHRHHLIEYALGDGATVEHIRTSRGDVRLESLRDLPLQQWLL